MNSRNPMTSRQVLERLVLAAMLAAVATYSVGSGDAALGVLAAPLIVLGWWATSETRGVVLPKIVGWILLAGAGGYALIALQTGGVNVSVLARFVAVLMVVKSFDRASLRDHAQILLLALFLTLATVVTTVILIPSALVVLSIATIVVATLVLQIEGARDAVEAGPPAPQPMPRRAWRALGASALVMGTISAVIAASVFVLVPRGIGSGGNSTSRNPLGANLGTTVGFTDEVDLGTGGTIQTDESVALIVEPINDPDIFAAAAPLVYLRGAVLETYRNGTWRRFRENENAQQTVLVSEGRPLVFSPVPTERGFNITIRATEDGVTEFFLPENTARLEIPSRREVRYDPLTGICVTLANGAPLEYRVFTSPLVRAEDRLLDPDRRTDPRDREVDDRIRNRVAEVLAATDLAGADVTDPDTAARLVSVLRSHLRSSFAYSLDRPEVPLGEDPTAWWLENAAAGHCEYFASALAQMCWTAGLDARLVMGYLAAEYNDATSAYSVRRSNAHAWVEVLIPGSGWVRADPTPAGVLRTIHQPEPNTVLLVRHLLDAFESLWINSIVAFDERSQSRLFDWGDDRGPSSFADLAERSQMLRGSDFVRAAGLGLAVFAAIAGLGFGLTILWDRYSAARRARARDDARVRSLGQRVLTIARRRGFPKPNGIPLKRHIASSSSLADLAPIAEALYLARFAGQSDATDHAAALLGTLETRRSSRTVPSD